MMAKTIWQHRAFNFKSDSLKIFNLFGDLYNSRMLFLALTPILALLTSGTKIYAYILTGIIAFILFNIYLETFRKLWVRNRLVYGVTDAGIYFDWKNEEIPNLEIPYQEISKISLVSIDNSDLSTIYFSMPSDDGYVADYAFLSDGNLNLLCFEKIPNGSNVFQLIEAERQNESNFYSPKSKESKKSYLEKVLTSRKFILLCSCVILFIGSFATLQVGDYYFNKTVSFEDTIIEETDFIAGGDLIGKTYTTSKGLSFSIGLDTDVGQHVILDYSNIFKNVSQCEIDGLKYSEYLYSGFSGLGSYSKCLLIILCYYISWHVIFKGINIDLEDLLFFVVLPLAATFITYCILNY